MGGGGERWRAGKADAVCAWAGDGGARRGGEWMAAVRRVAAALLRGGQRGDVDGLEDGEHGRRVQGLRRAARQLIVRIAERACVEGVPREKSSRRFGRRGGGGGGGGGSALGQMKRLEPLVVTVGAAAAAVDEAPRVLRWRIRRGARREITGTRTPEAGEACDEEHAQRT